MFKLEKKSISFLIYAFTALILLSAATAFLLAPKIAHQKIISGLKSAGFNTAYIPKPQTAFGAMLYSDLRFDENSFTTLKHLRVTYNPFTLFLTRRFKTLDLIDLTLTGDWADENPESLSFAGWSLPSSTATIPLTSFDHISIKNTRLSMLTRTAGVVSIFVDAELSRKKNKMEFQANLKSEQQYLSLITSANGLIEGARWLADIEIAEGKFETPSEKVKATRLSGWAKLTSRPSGPPDIIGQFQSGGLSLYGTPWQNASATAEYKNGDLKVFTEAKATGADDVELELNMYKKSMVKTAVAGSVHADSPDSLQSYLAKHPQYSKIADDLQSSKIASDANINFLVDDQYIRYELKNTEGTKILKAGAIDLP